MDTTAKAQVADALEQAAVALKRQIGVSRKTLQVVRQAQVGLLEGEARVRALGIEVQTHTKPLVGGTVDGDQVSSEAA